MKFKPGDGARINAASAIANDPNLTTDQLEWLFKNDGRLVTIVEEIIEDEDGED